MNEEAPVRTRTINPAPIAEPIDEFKQVNAANPMELAEQQLIAFIQDQIEKMKRSLKLGNTGNPSFDQVNTALTTYQDTFMALLAMHSDAKMAYQRAKEDFDTWFAEKYILTRDEVNPRSLSSQKWFSQKEIEMQVRTQYKKAYGELNAKMTVADHKLQFMRRLIESWQAQQYLLCQLSRNIIAEVSSLGMPAMLDNGLSNAAANQYGSSY